MKLIANKWARRRGKIRVKNKCDLLKKGIVKKERGELNIYPYKFFLFDINISGINLYK
jgi:hypothetical protein